MSAHQPIQLELELGIVASDAEKLPRPKYAKRTHETPYLGIQMELDLRECLGSRVVESPCAPSANDDIDEDDDALVSAPVVHRTIPASEAPMPDVPLISSIFAMHNLIDRVKPVRLNSDGERAITRIFREGDKIVCRRIAIQETQEWQDKEAARRARQKPPKPSAKYRTVGEKMMGGHSS